MCQCVEIPSGQRKHLKIYTTRNKNDISIELRTTVRFHLTMGKKRVQLVLVVGNEERIIF